MFRDFGIAPRLVSRAAVEGILRKLAGSGSQPDGDLFASKDRWITLDVFQRVLAAAVDASGLSPAEFFAAMN